ncbi:unnamed protein product [Caenorhabditis sp. 36 PRJEB53466]|nr:unnamed protein product [Caenorhabditis sp. 36 PRJEB53466]
MKNDNKHVSMELLSDEAGSQLEADTLARELEVDGSVNEIDDNGVNDLAAQPPLANVYAAVPSILGKTKADKWEEKGVEATKDKDDVEKKKGRGSNGNYLEDDDSDIQFLKAIRAPFPAEQLRLTIEKILKANLYQLLSKLPEMIQKQIGEAAVVTTLREVLEFFNSSKSLTGTPVADDEPSLYGFPVSQLCIPQLNEHCGSLFRAGKPATILSVFAQTTLDAVVALVAGQTEFLKVKPNDELQMDGIAKNHEQSNKAVDVEDRNLVVAALQLDVFKKRQQVEKDRNVEVNEQNEEDGRAEKDQEEEEPTRKRARLA